MSALRNISLRIAAGEHVAILGRVGSARVRCKTILGLYRPSEGAVLVDRIDLRLDPAELRRHVGCVPQDPTMFYGTLRDNLTIAARHADDNRSCVRRRSGISDFVNAHPKGFDMMVGERGESLSGGQRQGVAIARAAIADPPIILLDEPTGSMDHSSEEEISVGLRASPWARTMIVVTHRTSLLELVNRIIVVDSGKIVADGPKQQVVEALRQGVLGEPYEASSQALFSRAGSGAGCLGSGQSACGGQGLGSGCRQRTPTAVIGRPIPTGRGSNRHRSEHGRCCVWARW